MKTCPACNYQQGTDWVTTPNIKFGDEEFINIIGTFRVKHDNNYSHGDHAVELYACPKCGCVHMVDY